MRNLFMGYYAWTEDEFTNLWENALFVFDTNTLLNIYRYKETTCEMFLETLEAVQDAAWIPHHVGLEFHKNRRTCIQQQTEAYEVLGKELDGFASKFEQTLNGYKTHKLIDRQELLGKFKKTTAPIKRTITTMKKKHPNYITSDSVLERVTAVFCNRVGAPLEEEDMTQIRTEGEKRYEAKVPPGYKDKGKSELEKYGDLIIWKEMIKKAKEAERPIIFITSDNKEDWWLVDVKGKTSGPRPELLQEFKKETKQLCYLYQPSNFITRARDHFKLNAAAKEALDEIQKIRNESVTLEDWSFPALKLHQMKRAEKIHKGLLGEAFLPNCEPYYENDKRHLAHMKSELDEDELFLRTHKTLTTITKYQNKVQQEIDQMQAWREDTDMLDNTRTELFIASTKRVEEWSRRIEKLKKNWYRFKTNSAGG